MSRLTALWPALAAYALLWIVLHPRGGVALGAGAVAVAAALLARRALRPQPGRGIRWRALPRFAVLFAWWSLHGGLDVARRALSRDMRLQPARVWVPLGLRDEGARVLLALVVSLLPGTFAVRLEPHRLRLHVLDARQPYAAQVRRLEGEIASLFGGA